MDRRSFFRGLFGAVAVASTNPVSFFAPIGGWSSDVLINPCTGPISQASMIALQLEKVRRDLPRLFLHDEMFWKLYRTSPTVIQPRTVRVPFGIGV